MACAWQVAEKNSDTRGGERQCSWRTPARQCGRDAGARQSPGKCMAPEVAAATTEMEDETGLSFHSTKVTANPTPEPETKNTAGVHVPPRGVQRMPPLVSGSRTTSRRRRQRRVEGALAAANGILATEFREQHQERAKGEQLGSSRKRAAWR
ncbi:hypothetical protein PF004_g23362 [Phytophthora fragariae]|uniref:Uncharacterized protein n=1 Tax=Phytophthora fragariae TaxID=53985 RepID=A0A6G0MZ65_9STRA|nr:hypothetical protein PF004_g23362 [Phytophthora fragariae]